jgi:hypothetical protein
LESQQKILPEPFGVIKSTAAECPRRRAPQERCKKKPAMKERVAARRDKRQQAALDRTAIDKTMKRDLGDHAYERYPLSFSEIADQRMLRVGKRKPERMLAQPIRSVS